MSTDAPNGTVVLAYSGGLDTSALIPWLKEKYGYDVVACLVDLGRVKGIPEIMKRAKASGAIDAVAIDAKEEFAEHHCLPALMANALYEDKYPLSTAIGRPVIAKKLVETAHKYGATAVAQAHSFVFPQQRVRVFFAAQPCVPSQTPAPLARYRADELRVLQVLGQGGGGCMHVPACMSPSPEVSRPQRASNDVPPQQLGLLPPHKLPIPPAASRARASQLTTRPCHPRRRWSHGSASIRLLDMACPVDTTPLDQTTSKPLLCLPLQFATYNDLGPNRPILGGSAELPYPRRLFTGACCALRAGTPPGMRLCLLHASALFIQNPGAFPRMPSTRCSPHFVLLLSRPPPGGQRNRVQDPKGPSTFPAARRAGKQGRIQLRARGWGLVTPHWQTPLRALPTLPQTPKISNRPQFTKYRQAGFVVEKLSDMMSAQLDVMKSVKFNSECGRVGSGVGMRCSSCPRRPPTHVLPSSQQPLLPLAAPPRGPRL